MKLARGLINKNNPSEKLSSVIYGLSVIILQMDLLTDKAHKKKLYPLHSVDISEANRKTICHSIDEFNI